jgi:hypothetical protein
MPKRRNKETLVHQAADKHLKKLQAVMAMGFQLAKSSVNRRWLETALATGNRDLAERATAQAGPTLEAYLQQTLPDALLAVLADGGEAGLQLLRERLATPDRLPHSLSLPLEPATAARLLTAALEHIAQRNLK